METKMAEQGNTQFNLRGGRGELVFKETKWQYFFVVDC